MEPFKLNVLIVEDNLSFALELAMLVEEIGYNVIGPVDNSAEALELILSKKPEVILMDHQLKGEMTGIELGEKIKHLHIPILYITSFGTDEHYSQAKKSNMVGYLVKPVEKITLYSALELTLQNAYLKQKDQRQTISPEIDHFLSNECLFIKKKGIFHKLAKSAIAYIGSDDNYVKIVTTDKEEFVTRTPLNKIEEMLPAKDFMRTHRQYIVGLDKIQAFDMNEGTLTVAGQKIPISRVKRREISDLIRMLN